VAYGSWLMVTVWQLLVRGLWFVAYGNCWFVAHGNWRLLCLILRMEFPRVFLTPQTFTFKAIQGLFVIVWNACNTNSHNNRNCYTLSTAQKMRANGTVVTEILHFKYIMLNTGFGLSCYIKNKAYPDSQILKIIHICYKYKYLKNSPCLTP
jgi:hypothetical protein